MKTQLLIISLLLLNMFISNAQFGYYTEKSSITVYNGATRGSAPWDQDKLITYNGYQYYLFWDKSNYLALSRINVATSEVQTIIFPDKCFDINNGHRSVTMGISPIDGRLHLSYDHHNNVLNYRQSVAHFLDNPPANIDTLNFSQKMPLMPNDAAFESAVAYPMFFNDNSGRLYFFYRIGGSGNGDNLLHAYNATTGIWTRTGKFISRTGNYQAVVPSGMGFPTIPLSTSRNAYVNGILFDNNDRLHVTWTWREGNQTKLSGLLTNHDLCYAYSDDYGQTWKNNNGVEVANMSKNTAITISSPDIVVVSCPFGAWMMNQGSMAFDSYNNPHIFIYRSTVIAPTITKSNQHYMHYWKDVSGSWKSQYVDDTSLVVNKDLQRGDILISPDNTINLLYFLNGKYYIARSTEANKWADWKIYVALGGNVSGTNGRPDFSKWKSDGVIQIPVTLNANTSLAIKTLGISIKEPEIPQLTGVWNQNKSVIVQWWPSVLATSYDIYRMQSGGTYVKIASGVSKGSMQNTYIDLAVSKGITYSYKIKAVNDVGESNFSNELGITTTLNYCWNFNNIGNAEGWQLAKNVSGSVSNGNFVVTPTGSDPYITSHDNLQMSASYNQFNIVMRNATNGSFAQLFWATEDSPSFSDSRSKIFYLTNKDSKFTNYSLDLSASPGWSGMIKQFRLDVVNSNTVGSTQSVIIDSIKMDIKPTVWNFNTDANFEGWQLANNVSGSVSQGIFTVTPTGEDSYLKSVDNLTLSSDNNIIEVLMKNGTVGTYAEFFWIRDDDAVWNTAKSARFNLTVKDAGYTKYMLDLSKNAEWKGTIRQLRFDVVNTSNISVAESVGIDWIRISTASLSTEIKYIYENNQFRIFPNPATDYITVSSKSGGRVDAISLIDITGKKINVVATAKHDEITLQIACLSKGIYLLQLKTSEGMQTVRFIKK